MRLSKVPLPKIMLVGGSGTGKTHALHSLVDAGYEIFVIFTEPGMEILSDLPPSKCHWTYIPPMTTDWASMISSSQLINDLNFEALTKKTDINKSQYREWVRVQQALYNFRDERTGQMYGPVDFWGIHPDDFTPLPADQAGFAYIDPITNKPFEDKAGYQTYCNSLKSREIAWQQVASRYNLTEANDYGAKRFIIIDSLSGLNIMAMNLVVGSKPVKHQGDWGVAMDNEERLLIKLTTDVRVGFVLTAHLEREVDEVTGGVQLMASALGRKLAPRLPRFFSDVIQTKRDGKDFLWSTAATGVDLKARNVDISDRLPPNFGPLLSRWESRQHKENVA